jgi:hypothetical protein
MILNRMLPNILLNEVSLFVCIDLAYDLEATNCVGAFTRDEAFGNFERMEYHGCLSIALLVVTSPFLHDFL